MKTKQLITTLLLAFITLPALSQTLYYQEPGTYEVGDGVTYRCDIKWGGVVTLYNSANRYTYEKQQYLNGDLFPDFDRPETFTMTDASDWDIQERANRPRKTEYVSILRDERIIIGIFVDPQTGKVMEMTFKFATTSPACQLPPSFFREIEKQFVPPAPNIRDFAVTPEGRKLKFIYFWWDHSFSPYRFPMN